MSLAARLFLRRTLRRPLVIALTMVAVAAGATLPLAALIAGDSVASGGVRLFHSLAPTAALRLDAPSWRGGLTSDVLDRAANVNGVSGVVPLVVAVTLVGGRDSAATSTLVVGLPCATGSFGPTHLPCRALSSALARRLGDTPAILTGGATWTLQDYATSPGLDALGLGNVVTMPLSDAQRLFARGTTVDTALVSIRSSARVEQVRGALARVVTGRGRVVAPDKSPLGAGLIVDRMAPLFRVLGLANLGIGAVLAYQALTLFFSEQRRQLATLLALGTNERSLMLGGGFLGGLIGAIGGFIGIIGGAIVARAVVSGFDETVLRSTGLHSSLVVTGQVAAIAGLLGAMNGAAAGALAVRAIVRRPIASSLGSQTQPLAPQPRLRVLGPVLAGMIVVGLAITYSAGRDGSLRPWQPLVALGGMAVIPPGMMLLTGLLSARLMRPLARVARRVRPLVGVALSSSVAQWQRTAVLATVGATGIATALISVSSGAASAASVADGRVVPRPAEWVRVAATEMPERGPIETSATPELLTQLRATPGVGEVDEVLHLVSQTVGGSLVCVVAISGPVPSYEIYKGPKSALSTEGAVLIGPTLARALHLSPGSTLRLATPRGPVALRVSAVWADGRCQGRSLWAPMEQVHSMYGAVAPAEVWIDPGENAPIKLAADIDARLAGTGLHATQGGATVGAVRRYFDDQVDLTNVMARCIILVAAVAVASAFLLSVRRRRHEFGVLFALGLSRWAIAWTVIIESVVVSIIGAVFGVLTGALGMLGFTHMSAYLFGWSMPFRLDLGAAASAALLLLGVSVVAASAAAIAVSRLDVAEALGAD